MTTFNPFRTPVRYLATAAAALLTVGTGLAGGAAASTATPNDSGVHNFRLSINGVPVEWIVSVSSLTSNTAVVVRGPGRRSGYVDEMLGCKVIANSVTIDELNFVGNTIRRYIMTPACVARFDNAPGGQEQYAEFVFQKLTIE